MHVDLLVIPYNRGQISAFVVPHHRAQWLGYRNCSSGKLQRCSYAVLNAGMCIWSNNIRQVQRTRMQVDQTYDLITAHRASTFRQILIQIMNH